MKPEPLEKDLGGRPLTINDATLLNNRECWIAFLSNAWGDIGWPLRCVRTPDDVRKALALVETTTAQEQAVLRPFLRETTIGVTRAELSATRAALKVVREREYKLNYEGNTPTHQLLTDRVRESKDALRIMSAADGDDRTRLSGEHVRRVTRLATFKKQLTAIQQDRAALELTLTDQEAAFAQHELCVFLRKRKYAHSPHRVARAMAGLPDIGAWQSYRRCDEYPESPQWPTIQFRIFAIIAKAWQQRSDRSKRALLARVQKRVRAIRTMDRKRRPDHHSIGLQRYFFENWSYLVQAVEKTDVGRANPVSVPYLVFGSFMKRVAQATSPTERVLASLEQLSADAPARQKHGEKRNRR